MGVRFQNPTQMHLAQDNHMIDALAPDRSDQPFGKAILPRRGWRGRLVPDAHGAKSACDNAPIDPIPIPDELVPSLIPRKALPYLTSRPSPCPSAVAPPVGRTSNPSKRTSVSGWMIERNKAARSFRQLRRFLHVINSDKVFGTHRLLRCSRSERRRRAHIIGVSVSDTMAETTMATDSVSENSRKSRPTMPRMNRSGMNTAISDTVSETMVNPIWRAPL